MTAMATQLSGKIVGVVSAVLETEKKYTVMLTKKEFISLKESGMFDIKWAYDGKHSVVCKAGSMTDKM